MDATLLLATALAVALILILTYRSPVLWLLPLLAVGVASQVASAVVYLLARYAGLTVDFQSQSILTILVFGVGVDYALLLIARYREELRRHARPAPGDGLGAAPLVRRDRRVGRDGRARPALPARRRPAGHPRPGSGLRGRRRRRVRCHDDAAAGAGRAVRALGVLAVRARTVGEAADEHRVWRRIAAGVGRSPRLVWLVTAAALLALTGGIGSLGLGLPGDKSFTKEVGSVTGQHLIEAHYAAGTASPALVIAAAARGRRRWPRRPRGDGRRGRGAGGRDVGRRQMGAGPRRAGRPAGVGRGDGHSGATAGRGPRRARRATRWSAARRR